LRSLNHQTRTSSADVMAKKDRKKRIMMRQLYELFEESINYRENKDYVTQSTMRYLVNYCDKNDLLTHLEDLIESIQLTPIEEREGEYGDGKYWNNPFGKIWEKDNPYKSWENGLAVATSDDVVKGATVFGQRDHLLGLPRMLYRLDHAEAIVQGPSKKADH
jgi:hypothetical protein